MNHKKYWKHTRVKGAYRQGRKDAIDEFVNECIEYENLTFANEHIERIKKIAEQLKEQSNIKSPCCDCKSDKASCCGCPEYFEWRAEQLKEEI